MNDCVDRRGSRRVLSEADRKATAPIRGGIICEAGGDAQNGRVVRDATRTCAADPTAGESQGAGYRAALPHDEVRTEAPTATPRGLKIFAGVLLRANSGAETEALPRADNGTEPVVPDSLSSAVEVLLRGLCILRTANTGVETDALPRADNAGVPEGAVVSSVVSILLAEACTLRDRLFALLERVFALLDSVVWLAGASTLAPV